MAKKRGKLRKKLKKLGRAQAKVLAKVVKPVTAVLAGVSSAIVPGSGAVFAAAGSQIARHAGATAARDKGLHGRAARKKGRKLAKKTLKLGLIATAAGTGIGLGAAALGGTSAFTGIAGALKGRAGSKPPGAMGDTASDESLPNQILTSSELAGQLNPGGASGSGSFLDDAGKTLGNLLESTIGSKPAEKTDDSSEGSENPSGDLKEGFGLSPKVLLIGGAVVLGLMVLPNLMKAS